LFFSSYLHVTTKGKKFQAIKNLIYFFLPCATPELRGSLSMPKARQTKTAVFALGRHKNPVDFTPLLI